MRRRQLQSSVFTPRPQQTLDALLKKLIAGL
jgi:hypothetical protein